MFHLKNVFLYLIYKNDHKSSHKENAKPFKKINIPETIFWDQNKVKLKISNK